MEQGVPVQLLKALSERRDPPRPVAPHLRARALRRALDFIAAHPGCTLQDMQTLRDFSARELRHFPEQIQIFTPTPSTFSTLMYYTARDPFSGKALFVERDMHRKQQQKNQILHRGKSNSPRPGKKPFTHKKH